MKPSTGYAQPRRLAPPKKPARLDLRRQSAPDPEDRATAEPKSHFWRWVVLVALAHVAVVCLVYFIYEATPAAPKPPDTFIEMLPPGDKVKGTPGAQQAPKVGPTTQAPSAVKHTKPAPVVPPEPVTPPTPVAVQPPPPVPTPKPVEPVVKPDAPTLTQDKPVPVKPPTPKPPKVVPKVKVDLTLAEGPAADKPVTVKPPKPHPKKPAPTPADASNAPDRDTASDPNNSGLSKAQIAAALGQKVQAAGVHDGVKIGASGSQHSQANPFDAYYLSIRDQVMNKWQHPNLATEPAINPQVMIHVEKDGHVPPEMVSLVHSSGNADYDNTAVEAARSIGYTLQPLPDGCPPDIYIDFTLTH